MNTVHVIYGAYVLFFAILVALIIAVPIWAFDNDVGWIYKAFEFTCHQKLSRSLCVFSDGTGYWIADCTKQEGIYTTGPQDRSQIKVEAGSAVGYKMPVCSRDFGLYAAMLAGALAYPLARRLDDDSIWPSIFLVAALIPIGIDGGLQLVSEIGLLPFVYESTNAIRLITGVIAGFVASFYALAILVNLGKKD